MILHFNAGQYNSQLSHLNEGKEAIQNLMAEFKKLDIATIDFKKNFVEIIKDGESFIKSKIVESIEPPMFGNYRMKKQDFINTLELPDFTAFTEANELCKEYESDLKYFSFDGNKVVINTKEVEALKERLSTVAKTPKQIRLAKAHEQAAKALTELNNAMADLFGQGRGLFIDHDIKRYFLIKDGEYITNEYFYEDNKHLFNK